MFNTKDIDSQRFVERVKMLLERSNDSHDIYTPLELCQEVVSKIPSLDGKVLVIANLEFVYTLKRMDVPVENIHFATPCPLKAMAAKSLLAEHNVFMYNGVITKKDVGDMKFDVVVGNPPYQKSGKGRAEKLWPKFTYTSIVDLLKDNGWIGFVIPDSWTNGSGNVVKGRVGLYHDVFKKYSLTFCNLNVARYFSTVGSADYISYIILQKAESASVDTIFVTKSGEKMEINLNNFNFLPRLSVERLGINQKTVSSGNTFAAISFTGGDKNRKQGSDEPTDSKTIKTFTRGGNLHETYWAYFSEVQNPKAADHRKVILPLSGAEKFMPFVDDVGVPHCMSSYVILLEDGDVGEYTIQVFNSKLFKFLVQENRTSGFAQPYVLKRLPKVDLNRSWTDEELYAHFNLTEEEIKLIEDTIK